MVLFNGARLIYVQANPCLSGCSPQLYDQILGYRRDNTWQDLTSPPGDNNYFLDQGSTTSHYGGPSAFIDANQVFMTIGQSTIDGSGTHTLLWGSSPDGIRDWSFQTLFTSVGYDVPGITLKYANIGGQDYWWGFLRAARNDLPPPYTGLEGLGVIRVHLSLHDAANAVPDRVDVMGDDGLWKSSLVGQPLAGAPGLLGVGEQLRLNPKLHWLNGE